MENFWKDLEKEEPEHKDLVLCWDGTMSLPAIYYDNQSYKGFWVFTTFYHEYRPTVYSNVKLKPKHEIKGVIKWRLIDEPKEY
jgi:hypothetical protein